MSAVNSILFEARSGAAGRIARLGSGLLTFVMIVTGPALVWGAPSWGDEFTLEQPDGTAVQVKIWGDEFYRVVESLDGFTLVRDSDTGEICYAEVSGDGRELLSTGYIVDGISGQDLGLERHLRIDPEVARAIAQSVRDEAAAVERAELATKGIASGPLPSTLGDVKGLLLIIDFSDEPAIISAEAIDDYANLPGYTGYGNNGSVRDYFYDVSNGLLTYTNRVSPTWYRALKPKSYYDDCDAPYGSRARELVREALIDLNNQGLDFSEYDANGDGYIDAINCFYAGVTNCGWAMGLWPHSSTGLNFTADGVSSYRYQVTGIGTNLTLSTFCHENGHMIGFWPDLYDYDGSSRGVGRFCLMCTSTSATNPQEPSAYMKDLAGWATIVDLDFFQQNLPATAGSDTIYRFQEGRSDYYLVENRYRTGRDSLIPDSGLAIWHCDPNGDNNDEDQTPFLHYEVTLVQADGNWDLENSVNYGDSTDLWGAPDYTEFSALTDPAATWWDGTPAGLFIESISAVSPSMTFTINPDGGLNVPDEYPTIQAALDIAANGQEIILADGTYTGPGNRDLDFGGVLAILRSQSGDPTQCILDLEGAVGDEHRAFLFHNGETSAAVVEGVTILNGFVAGSGGAIQLDGSSPTLRNIIFQNNEATAGGAIHCLASSPFIEGCTFYGSSADQGQAIYCKGGSTPVASRVLITDSTGLGLPAEGAQSSDYVTFDCSDIFGNANGDWLGDLDGLGSGDGNFSLNPAYCDAAAGDLTVLYNSPCAPGWHPEGAAVCGGQMIGAGIVGCTEILFTEVSTGPAAVTGDSRGAAVGDYDGDGAPDIFVVNHNSADVLLRNDGAGNFIDVTAAPLGDAGPGTSAAWADYDNDGDLDLYLAKLNAADILYCNEGGGVFIEPDIAFLGDDGPCVDVSWIDYDNDGYLDIYLVKNGAPNVMIRGLGDDGSGGWFFWPATNGSLAVGGASSSADWCDFDHDGDQDVLVVSAGNNSFLENFGALGFDDMADGSPLLSSVAGSGADWGDMDNDGLMDIYIANNSWPDMMARNEAGTFTQSVSPIMLDTGAGQGGAWGDLDNDGLLDFYLARDGQDDLLFWNAGGGNFNPVVAPAAAGSSRGVAWADFNNDGALDLYTTRDGTNILALNVYETANHWLQVRLQGTTSNRSGIGSRLQLMAGGLDLVRDVQTSSGYLAQSSLTVEFGLGEVTAIDSLIVEWPSGTVDVYKHFTADRVLVITEGVGPSAVNDEPIVGVFALRGNVPNPFNPTTMIQYELPVKSAVQLQIFDIRGRLVRRLRSGEIEAAGRHQVAWNGRDSTGRQVSSGTYFYRLEADGHQAVRRMVLLK
jgi:M6 family metalloprotease-like protein